MISAYQIRALRTRRRDKWLRARTNIRDKRCIKATRGIRLGVAIGVFLFDCYKIHGIGHRVHETGILIQTLRIFRVEVGGV